MTEQQKFIELTRSDGSKVAVQLETVLFFTKASHGSVLNFGGSTQVNIKEEFEDLLGIINGDGGAGGDGDEPIHL